MGAGHSVTALYEIKFHDEAQGPVANVRIRYQDPDHGEVVEINREFSSSQLSTSFEQASPRFQLDAAVAEYAEILRESFWALESSMQDVRLLAQRVATMLPEDRDVSEFALMVILAEQLGAGE